MAKKTASGVLSPAEKQKQKGIAAAVEGYNKHYRYGHEQGLSVPFFTMDCPDEVDFRFVKFTGNTPGNLASCGTDKGFRVLRPEDFEKILNGESIARIKYGATVADAAILSSQNAAISSENEALKRQIEELRNQTKAKNETV